MSAAATAAGYLYASGRMRGECRKRRFDSEMQALLNAPKPSQDPHAARWRADLCLKCPGKWHLNTFYARAR